MKSILTTALLALTLAASPIVQAQQSSAASHGAHSSSKTIGSAAPSQPATTARQALDQSMGRMHDDMMRGIAHDDADVAFAAGMLAHHEGAVEMARIQLHYGKDATLRQLAQEVIRAQEAEITLLKGWLAKRGLAADGQPQAKPDAHAGH